MNRPYKGLSPVVASEGGTEKDINHTFRTASPLFGEIKAKLFELTRDRSISMERYQRYADIETLPDDAIADLLDRVTVWPDGRMEVSLKFLNELPVSVGVGLGIKVDEQAPSIKISEIYYSKRH